MRVPRFRGGNFPGVTHAQSMFACAQCKAELDPADADVVYAVALVEVTAFGVGTRLTEGLSDYFHEACFPSDAPWWRLKPKPSSRFAPPAAA
jgi:hypothetical protein